MKTQDRATVLVGDVLTVYIALADLVNNLHEYVENTVDVYGVKVINYVRSNGNVVTVTVH